MDGILAILVLSAVIFFGALISAGNERQRKALDGIREQAVLWAMQDLRIKHEKLARNVKVDDPLTWLNNLVTKVYGENLGLTVSEVLDNPHALICSSLSGRKVVFSLISPSDIKRKKREQKSKLSQDRIAHPLMNLSYKVEQVEITILNGGILFDKELNLAWKALVGFDTLQPNGQLWMYL